MKTNLITIDNAQTAVLAIINAVELSVQKPVSIVLPVTIPPPVFFGAFRAGYPTALVDVTHENLPRFRDLKEIFCDEDHSIVFHMNMSNNKHWLRSLSPYKEQHTRVSIDYGLKCLPLTEEQDITITLTNRGYTGVQWHDNEEFNWNFGNLISGLFGFDCTLKAAPPMEAHEGPRVEGLRGATVSGNYKLVPKDGGAPLLPLWSSDVRVDAMLQGGAEFPRAEALHETKQVQVSL